MLTAPARNTGTDFESALPLWAWVVWFEVVLEPGKQALPPLALPSVELEQLQPVMAQVKRQLLTNQTSRHAIGDRHHLDPAGAARAAVRSTVCAARSPSH